MKKKNRNLANDKILLLTKQKCICYSPKLSSQERTLQKLLIEPLPLRIRKMRLGGFVHLERMKSTDWLNTVFNTFVPEKKTWTQQIDRLES